MPWDLDVSAIWAETGELAAADAADAENLARQGDLAALAAADAGIRGTWGAPGAHLWPWSLTVTASCARRAAPRRPPNLAGRSGCPPTPTSFRAHSAAHSRAAGTGRAALIR